MGELALLLGTRASASVTTGEPSVLYRLSGDGRARIMRDSPDVAAALQKYLALRLAERFRKTNTTLTAMLH